MIYYGHYVSVLEYNHYNVFSTSDAICSSSKENLDSNEIRKSPKGLLLNNTSDYS